MFDFIQGGDPHHFYKIKRELEEASQAQSDVFGKIANGIEDTLQYVQELEKNVEELNKRLIDNTPEHVDLICDFIQKTALQIADESIKQYEPNIFRLREEISSSKKQNELLAKQLEEKSSTITKQILRVDEIFNKYENCKKVIYWQSLPLKLVHESSLSSSKHSAFTGDTWVKITKEKFDLALSSTYFSQSSSDPDDFDISIKEYEKIPLPKEINNALLFDLV